ncbi:MAG: methyltransferase regulatory domain-containing protein [Rhodocyclales bacterium]|nr:methyltransferase regulatory domain-containing protein [Rhodocyclales bacterium]
MATDSPGYVTDVVYTDNYYEQLSPLALNYLAALNGHPPVDPGSFDYCELGCGLGLSLLVHAATHPGGRFVGVDLNPEHIARAQARADAAGITNLRLLAEPFGDELTASGLPDFDFIVLHGVYSYLPENVRLSVHRFIDARLKPGGQVLISYNAMPGWAGRRPLRDIMRRFAVPLAQNSLERAQLGLSYLRLMLDARAPFFALNPELEKYAESLFQLDLHYIAHEFFHEQHNAYAVDQVAGDMGGMGLAFAGTLPLWQNHVEADIPANLTGLFTADTGRIAREAHKDFIYNTVFRTDLYVRPAPRVLAAHDRCSALWNTPFCSVTEPDAVQLTVQRGALQLPLNTRESRIILSLLQDAPRTPAQLHAHPGLQAMPPTALVDAICWWVLSGQARPATTIATDAGNETVAHLNRTLLADAMHDQNATTAWLGSPRFGCAFEFDKTQALALCALSGSGDTPSETALWELMQACGLSFEEGDGTLGPAEVAQLALDLHDELEANGALERARKLGVVA